MNIFLERKRLKSLLSSTSGSRDWAAKEFDTAQKQLIVDRSAFFDRLALFHSGTIAATISFAGILHQPPKTAIQWKYVLFASWITLFFAMVAALIRNWQAQNALYYTTRSTFEKHEGEFKDASAKAALSGGSIVDRKTGEPLDPSKVKTGAAEVAHIHERRSREYSELGDKYYKYSSIMEKITFIATAVGIALALAFAMRNFS